MIARYWRKFITWFYGLFNDSEGIGILKDNESIIMQQLFNGQDGRLKTSESMMLFDKIESQFYLKIKDRYFDLHEAKDEVEREIELIERYKNGKDRQKNI